MSIKNVLLILDNSCWQFDMDHDETGITSECFYLTHWEFGDIIEYDVLKPEDLWIDHNKLMECFSDLKIFGDDFATKGGFYMGTYRKRIEKIVRSKYKIPHDTAIL